MYKNPLFTVHFGSVIQMLQRNWKALQKFTMLGSMASLQGTEKTAAKKVY
jgi:hypothetical protein